MRRRIAALLSTALVAGVFMVLAPAQPAHAVWVCAGTGTAATTNPVFYPTFGGTSQNQFAFSFGAVGACAHIPTAATNKALTATGTFLGYCGLSSGLGTTGNGELFAWIAVGGTLILTGHLDGIVNAAPDVLNGESCMTGGADRFLVNGGAILLNCPDDLGPLGILDRDALVPDLPVLGEMHLWINAPCVPNLLDLA